MKDIEETSHKEKIIDLILDITKDDKQLVIDNHLINHLLIKNDILLKRSSISMTLLTMMKKGELKLIRQEREGRLGAKLNKYIITNMFNRTEVIRRSKDREYRLNVMEGYPDFLRLDLPPMKILSSTIHLLSEKE